MLGSFPVGGTPSGVAFDGVKVWVAQAGSDTIAGLRLDGAVQDTFEVGDGPSAVAYDGTSIWIASREEGMVFELLRQDFTITITFLPFNGSLKEGGTPITEVPHALKDVAVTYTSDSGFSGTDSFVAIVNNGAWDCTEVITTITPEDALFDKLTDRLLPLDIVMTPVCTYEVGDQPVAIAFDGQNVWVAASGAFTVTKVSRETGIQETYSVNEAPTALAFDGERIW